MLYRSTFFAALLCALTASYDAHALSFPGFGKDKDKDSDKDNKDGATFDKGEMDDLKKGVIVKDQTDADRVKLAKKKKEAELEKQAKAVKVHLKNLRSSDWEERATAAEYLGVMGSLLAVDELIEVLNPSRKEREIVMRAAHGALIKLTGKNISMKNYDEWYQWWRKNKLDVIKKKENEVTETDKIAADNANETGRVYMRSGEYRMALREFHVALEKNPRILDYNNNAGLATMELGRAMDAMEYFKEAMSIDPEMPQPYMNMGRCYSRMDRTIEAQSWYKKALDKDKKGLIWDNFWMIGKEYLRHGDYKLAYEYLDQARIKMEKQRLHHPLVYNDLAICHYALDEYHSAWKELCNIRFLGYEPNPDFVGKVRKVLVENGVDPDEEDRLVREHLKELNQGEPRESEEVVAKKDKKDSILDSLEKK